MSELKFKIKDPRGKMAYHGQRIAEAAQAVVRLVHQFPGSTVTVQTYQGDVQCWLSREGCSCEGSGMIGQVEWLEEFQRLVDREEERRGKVPGLRD